MSGLLIIAGLSAAGATLAAGVIFRARVRSSEQRRVQNKALQQLERDKFGGTLSPEEPPAGGKTGGAPSTPPSAAPPKAKITKLPRL